MEQPLGRVSNLSNQTGERTACEPSLWHGPSKPQAHVRGRRFTGSDDMFIFVNEGIRKLSDLNTVRGNNTRFILIGDTWWRGVAQLSRNLRHKKIGKHRVRPSPGGLWQAVSERVLRHEQNQAHSGQAFPNGRSQQ